MESFLRGGYYAILNVSAPADGFWPYLPIGVRDPWPLAEMQARQLLEANPCCFQIRAKDAPASLLFELGERLAPLCREAGIPLCINDRLDVALAIGASFVHLGQDDLSVVEARRFLERANLPVGTERIRIGISTHSRSQAVAAERDGADLIGFGPVFSTGTKLNPDPVVGLAALGEVVRLVGIPVVAIGGIDLGNVASVAQTGAHAAAVISAVQNASDPGVAGRQVAAAFSSSPG
ncbi:MAG: thiamine phosphate synthase [Deltaproteobacteria bacterium]|nr:thiamine phosphate synthase [Deltaproteobacteria bacterium]